MTPDDIATVPCTVMDPWPGAQVVTRSGEQGVAVDVTPDREHGISVAHPRGCRSHDVAPLIYLRRDLALDLTHRPTRLEALVLLAERSGLGRAGGGGGPRWLRAEWVSETCWAVDAGTSGGWDARDIPALGEIDRADDTRLPGGAMVVDVRALAIVLRHVFGGAA